MTKIIYSCELRCFSFYHNTGKKYLNSATIKYR